MSRTTQRNGSLRSAANEQLAQLAPQPERFVERRRSGGEPTVAEPDGAVQGPRRVASEDDVDRHRFGGDLHPFEPNEPGSAGDLAAAQRVADDLDTALETLDPLVERNAERGELLEQPAGAHPEGQPPAGELLDGAHRSGDRQRVAEGEDEDPGRQFDHARRRGRCAEGDERIDQVDVRPDDPSGVLLHR